MSYTTFKAICDIRLQAGSVFIKMEQYEICYIHVYIKLGLNWNWIFSTCERIVFHERLIIFYENTLQVCRIWNWKIKLFVK